MKDVILDSFDALAKFSINGKKDESFRVIMTYISLEIWFHTSAIDFPHEFWVSISKGRWKLSDGDREIVDPSTSSFLWKDWRLFGSYQGTWDETRWMWKGFPKKDGYLIKMVLMNRRTTYDVFLLSFHTNWLSHKEDGKDYSFDVFCDLLIRD